MDEKYIKEHAVQGVYPIIYYTHNLHFLAVSAGMEGRAKPSLDAKLASMRGDRDSAIAHWSKAVAIQDAMAYDEPPAWYYPLPESLGGELLRAAKPAEAEAVFRGDLKRNPVNGRSLFGLPQALKAQNKDAEAAKVAAQFQRAWDRADVVVAIADL